MTLNSENNEGWAFFKRGAKGHHGKIHYLKNWRSLCGQYSVWSDEEKHMHFTAKSEFRDSKICKRCNYISEMLVIPSHDRNVVLDFPKNQEGITH